MRWTPFSSSGGPNASTERVPMKYYLMEMDVTVDGGGHLVRTNLLLCRSMCKRLAFALMKYYLMEMDVTVDGGGHLVRTNLLLLCCSMCKRLAFALIWLARP